MLKNDDFDKPKTECGLIAAISKDPSVHVAQIIFRGLMALQHRGQEAAGISVFDSTNKISTYKNYGLVFEALSSDKLARIWGHVGIGQVRYGTAGSGDIRNAQPFQFETTQTPPFSIAFNGNITNFQILKDQLRSKGHNFLTNGDTEVIANILASNFRITQNWMENLKYTAKMLDGAYSLIVLTEDGEVFAYRSGNKPLCYGKAKMLGTEVYLISSESCAIRSLGGDVIADVQPGELIHVHQDHDFHREWLIPVNPHHCIFEYVYFARADSIIDGKSVHQTRERLGRNLAKMDIDHGFNFENTVVVPVPDSGRSAALGYAAESGVRYDEGLMKNRYVFRSFITPNQAERMNLVRMKLNPVESIIKGKRVILIDDSIVRGTTMGRIVHLLRWAGASEIHVRSSCPPIQFPCFYGVDFPSKEELTYCKKQALAKSHEDVVELIRQDIEADSLEYLSIEGLIDAVDLKPENCCLACWDGKYWFSHERTKDYLKNGRI
ncbi:MAG: amidophosphoribosyltransferase [Promethearchaeota archaeon]